jgi:EAL domain-containing protein (putative c-di-GMP-specific phosphodiesterase class I)
VSPDKFIEIAEEIGVIGELGHWVLEAACERLVADLVLAAASSVDAAFVAISRARAPPRTTA